MRDEPKTSKEWRQRASEYQALARDRTEAEGREIMSFVARYCVWVAECLEALEAGDRISVKAKPKLQNSKAQLSLAFPIPEKMAQ
jgi:hypothetical protein